MDDILKRLLELERQAAQVVARAETEAERLLDEGRQQALAEGERLRAELAAETRRVLADRVALAQHEKGDALRAAEERLQARARAFARDVHARMDHVSRALAYPTDAPER